MSDPHNLLMWGMLSRGQTDMGGYSPVQAGTAPQLSAYTPTLRDRLATWWSGDKPSPERNRLVEGLLGSRGVGTTGFGLLEMFPVVGQIGAAQDAWRGGDDRGLAMAMLPAPKWNPNSRWIHGTSGTHTNLDASYGGRISSGAGRGIWLTEPTEKLYANEYAQRAAHKMGGEPRILQYEASGVKNPAIVQMDFDNGHFVVNGKPMPDSTENIDIIRWAENNGHDAVHWVDGSFTDPPSLTVFDGNKLKYIGE